MQTNKPFQLGSISEATLRPQDLLNAFGRHLNHLTLNQEKPKLIEEASEAEQRIWDNDDDDAHEQAGYILEELTDALNELCPPFVYFGAHPGDGADFGFWPDVEHLQEEIRYNGRPMLGDSEYTYLDDDGLLVHINDHGNVSVFDQQGNLLWDCV